MLKGKTIIVGVSSSIAAYKACEVVSRLRKLEADVWVAMTASAAKLITPLTFRTLSGNPVITDLFSPELAAVPVPHISLTQKADLLLIAPATANTIGKLANGIADDPLTTMALAFPGKKLFAPAMNPQMWRNPLVVKNVETLKGLKWEMIGPAEGKLACGDEDIGRLFEPEGIVEKVVESLGGLQDLKGKHVLVTAGGTKEAIDPVRYISNRSSGKMGLAIARAARQRGASVTLISANGCSPGMEGIKTVKVESATGMLEAVLDYYNNSHAVVMAAAVADFRPVKYSKGKIKKAEHGTQNTEHRIELKPTEDILQAVARQKGRKQRVLVGFALETDAMIENAKAKLKAKDLDLIVANDPGTFDSDSIKFSLIDKSGKVQDFPQQSKDQAAQVILDKILHLI